MWRMWKSAKRNRTRQARPVVEDLEGRRLLSLSSLHHAETPAAVSSGGGFSQNDRKFAYSTPSGGKARIRVVGIGNLTGTTVDNSGALHVVYGGTNAYSKVVGHVQGGNGHVPLASILNRQLTGAGAAGSLSGIGGNVLQSVLMSDFDLIAGGTINLTPGVNSLVLDSVGPNTQINLRALPPAPAPTTTTVSGGVQFVATQSSTAGTGTTLNQQAVVGTTTSSGSSASTLEAGQSTTVATPYGTSNTYASDSTRGQTLTAVSGTFTSAGNIQEPLADGQPPSIPPAPPGVILKVNRIAGGSKSPVNLQTDSKIFGYDPATGQLIRFDLNLANNTGTPDPTLAPINVPGQPSVAGVNLGRNGNQFVVLVSSGTNVYAYNATTGAAVGSFAATAPINSIASTDTVTVLGSYQTNQLQMIDLAASLRTGTVQPAAGSPQPFTPQAGFTFLGGLTGLPGQNTVYATIAATFNSFQPTETQLGVQTISTAQATTVPKDGAVLSNRFSSVTQTALTQQGTYTTVVPNALVYQPGIALGSVDQNLALESAVVNGKNVVKLTQGSLSINYPNPLAALSANFRPDLTGSALIDIQGTLQSIRGKRAEGMVLNDTGNLNLVKFDSVANSTIVGQPINHIQIKKRSNVSIVSSARDVGRRNDVTVVNNLPLFGPLSQVND